MKRKRMARARQVELDVDLTHTANRLLRTARELDLTHPDTQVARNAYLAAWQAKTGKL